MLPKMTWEPWIYLIPKICFQGGVLNSARCWPAKHGLTLETVVGLGLCETSIKFVPAQPALRTGPRLYSLEDAVLIKRLTMTGVGVGNVLLIQTEGK